MPFPRARGVALAATAAAALACAISLSGCGASPEPTAAPTPAASDAAAPIFASDEEALAAAVAAYEAYAEASDAIMREAGANPGRLEGLVTARYAPQLYKEFESIAESGIRVDGPSKVDTTSIATRDESDGSAEVSIYMCRDVTGVRVLNAAGDDITPPDREDRVPSQAFLVSSANDAHILVVDEVTRWSGKSFC
ncbi:hypothetical protein [Agromyces sp. Leaf222]|uniref:hypothetical protein n=1 Tax=Agromyces sp. Leaf222 TaxID=1735688 RepID=UPI0012F9CE01|nr:hypothetical protein [Agromyces sp. Leaf222]